LVKAATGEVISAEELGGGDVHTRLSGVADYLADDDGHALELARQAVAALGPPQGAALARREPVAPALDPASVWDVVPADLKTPYDIREVIARVVDGSDFDEFKARFGVTLICGFAHINGLPCGIIANNGILFSESAQKGAHFVQPAQNPVDLLAKHHRIYGRQKGRGRGHCPPWRQAGNSGCHNVRAQDHRRCWRVFWRRKLWHGGTRL
jgi:acetyl-CoA carboxylase carboxyltransferase component